MKKRLLLGTVICSLLVVLFSCSHEIGVGPGTKETVVEANGSISGTVRYSNAEKDQNGGIMITLDKTDGLNTIAVTKSAVSRSIVDSARTVVSSSYTSQDGTYSFSNLEPGTYTVYASSASSKEKAVYTNAVVKPDENTVVDPLNLTATGSITGRVIIDANEWGNIGFLVFVAGTSYMAMTDDGGYYTISDVPAGNYYQIVATKNNVIHFIDYSVYVTANQTSNVITCNYTSSELETAIKGEDGKDGKDGEDGKDGARIEWLGSFASETEIPEPKYLNAFFNTTDGCSYIYDGSFWTLLAKAGKDGESGKDGTSIVWKGEHYSAPEYPEINWAYFSTKDGCSYIWNGYSWDRLSIKGDNGTPIIWLGEDYNPPVGAKTNYAYFNIIDGCSYIYNGSTWDRLTVKGDKGDYGIIWRGESGYAPREPEVNWAYYNTEDGCSYIWTGYEWMLLAARGESIIWKGELDITPSSPEKYWAYYDTKDGCSYIWNGYSWDNLSTKGDKGTPIVWKGELDEAPNAPDLNWAYYDLDTGCSYIWNGYYWNLLALKGETGTSILWKGEFEIAPTNPKLYWAYYNISDGCSYLYDGTNWTLFARAGAGITWLGSYNSVNEIDTPVVMGAYYNITDGCSYIYYSHEWHLIARKGSDGTSGSGDSGFVWRGDFADDSEITEPAAFDVYFNTTTGCAYIYNGTEWKLLTRAGTNGKGITWMGSLPSASPIVNPLYMNAYYNTTDGCSYIYNGTKWVLLAKAGKDGLPYDGTDSTQGMLPLMSAYAIGDVLLNDGTIIPYNAEKISFTEEQKKRAVAVMYGNEYGIPAGWLGIYNSCGGANSGKYAWATGSTGTGTIFDDIICSADGTINISGEDIPTFSGDFDGSDNWDYIKSIDPEGIKFPSNNYPAFDYAQKYASRFGLTGEYASRWYIPSLSELYYIYRSKTKLNAVLHALGGIELYSEDYWSSSQEYYYFHYYDSDKYAMYVNFADGRIDHTDKVYQKRVCVVHSIDKAPPEPIKDLRGAFFAIPDSPEIIISWTNSADPDLAYILLSYKKNGVTVIYQASIIGNRYEVYNVETDGAEYEFTISSVDKAGNISESKVINVTVPNY